MSPTKELNVKKNQKKSKPSKSSAKSNSRRPAPRPRQSEENEMLAEFSDDYNDFYVDEFAENLRREREESDEREERREDARAARRKPASPLKRKIIRIVSTVAIVAVILTVGVILSLTVLFKTSAYEVVGNTLYLEEEIIEICGIAEGENIFLASKGAAEERIVSHFPYIEDADVTFKIPDTIKIEITEAEDGYLFKVSGTEYLVISKKGRVLNRIADKRAYSLPVFIGPQLKEGEIGRQVVYEDESVMDIISDIMQVFSDNGYQGITEIDATDTSGITFTYDGRIRVKLGIPEDLSYKIRTAMTVINGSIDITPSSRQQGTLDVSRCKDTKRSYFREGEINPTTPAATQPTQPTQPADSGEDWSDEWSDGDYDWSEDDWSEDDWSEDDWSEDDWSEDDWSDGD